MPEMTAVAGLAFDKRQGCRSETLQWTFPDGTVVEIHGAPSST